MVDNIKYFTENSEINLQRIQDKSDKIFNSLQQHVVNLEKLNKTVPQDLSESAKKEMRNLLMEMKSHLSTNKELISEVQNDYTEVVDELENFEGTLPSNLPGNELKAINTLKSVTENFENTLPKQIDYLKTMANYTDQLIDEIEKKSYTLAVNKDDIKNVLFNILAEEPCALAAIVDSCIERKMIGGVKPLLSEYKLGIEDNLANFKKTYDNHLVENYVKSYDFTNLHKRVMSCEEKLAYIKSEIYDAINNIKRNMIDDMSLFKNDVSSKLTGMNNLYLPSSNSKFSKFNY